MFDTVKLEQVSKAWSLTEQGRSVLKGLHVLLMQIRRAPRKPAELNQFVSDGDVVHIFKDGVDAFEN